MTIATGSLGHEAFERVHIAATSTPISLQGAGAMYTMFCARWADWIILELGYIVTVVGATVAAVTNLTWGRIGSETHAAHYVAAYGVPIGGGVVGVFYPATLLDNILPLGDTLTFTYVQDASDGSTIVPVATMAIPNQK